jgi:hypothetical protein
MLDQEVYEFGTIRICGTVSLTKMDPAPDLPPVSDPTPDPTHFFSDFKNAKKKFFIFNAGSSLSSLTLIPDNKSLCNGGKIPLMLWIRRIHN